MRLFLLVVTLGLASIACGTSDAPPTTAADSTAPLPPAPRVQAGSSISSSIQVAGTTVEYVAVFPRGFEVGDTAPVLVAMPPGGQGLDTTQRVIAGTYQAQAIERGWVVVSPAAPGGTLFFDGSEALMPGFLRWIESWVDAEGGALHLAGISNGGISAFRVAGENPQAFRSIVVFPGFARSRDDQSALDDLTGVAVRMFVGGTDTAWIEPMHNTVNRLNEGGGDATLEIFEGEGHVIESLSDGVRIFTELDRLR